jgi:uracil-DNA glycosylase family 4
MEDAAEQLDKLALSVGECVRCQELVAQRLRAVPGGGHPHCAVMIVSLDPDPADEAEGRPAGTTLVTQLAEFMPALSDASDTVYVTTLLKCVARSAGAARPPATEELDNCFPFLSKELSITTPHYILTVGEQATRYMLHRLFKDQPHREGDSLELRVFDNPAFRIVPVAHPAELRARDSDERREYADRLKTLAQVMGI